MIETYIFDLYGTLVDIRTDESMPTLWRRMALFLSLQGASYGPKELRRVYQEAVAEEIDRCAARRPDVPKEHIEPDILQVFESLYTRKGVSASPERVADAALLFRTLSIRHIRLYPQAGEVLRTLRARGKGVYLLSNAQAAFTVPELNKLGNDGTADIQGAAEVGMESRYIHTSISPDRPASLPKTCWEIISLQELL